MSTNQKLRQHDLRKAMNDLKKKSGVVKKIDSPLAKYNDAGQLMCIICKSIVRNETVWVVHLNSRSHKDNVSLTKKILSDKESSKKTKVTSVKRPFSPTKENESNKKVKGILKNPGHSQSSALPADFFDDTNPHGKTAVASVTRDTEKSSIIIDNNRKEVPPIESEYVMEAESSAAAALPEGFFDDPILDAKVRNVEYKNPFEEEWEKFTKEIKEEAAQSAQIIADDQEEATTERQLDEIDEQIGHWSRVMTLVRCKEKINITQKKADPIDEAESSDGESDYDEFVDWRAKNSYK